MEYLKLWRGKVASVSLFANYGTAFPFTPVPVTLQTLIVVARVLYLDNYGNLSNGRGLPPLVPHYNQHVIGGDIDRGHEARLTGD